MSSVENRRLAQAIIDQLFIEARFELSCAKNNATIEAKEDNGQTYHVGRYVATKRMIEILETLAGIHYLRIPLEISELKLVVNNTK